MEKQVIFITGTSSGFGLHTSIALAKQGYYVCASMRGLERRRVLEKYIEREELKNIEIFQLDVTDHAAVTLCIDRVMSRLGKIDVLINNAGYAMGGFCEDLTMEDYRDQFETNFFGLVAVTKAVLPHMREQRRGKILNMSSISGIVGFPTLSPYTASKFALEGFSESLRLEMLAYDVYVSLIEPGAYKTEIWNRRESNQDDSPYGERMDKMMDQINEVAKNAADPREVVDLLLRIIREKKPKLRYPIGRGVKRSIWLKSMIPWTWLEKSIVSKF